MGPAYFPTILGGLLLAIGVIAVIRSFIMPGPADRRVCDQGAGPGHRFGCRFWVSRARSGLAIALPLLVIISAYGSTRFRWRPTLMMAAGLTIFCAFVFFKGLGIPLPIIGPWFGG